MLRVTNWRYEDKNLKVEVEVKWIVSPKITRIRPYIKYNYFTIKESKSSVYRDYSKVKTDK